MSTEENVNIVRDFMERAFNQGDLSAVDEYAAQGGVDHQEPPGTAFRPHLKQVITMLHTAFPDLHFEFNHIMADGDLVAFHATMTGTHQGVLNFGPRPLPPTGRKISVAHMYFVRLANGKNSDLWHVWDVSGLMRQLGALPEQQKRPA
jgi:predicted ester cyclase